MPLGRVKRPLQFRIILLSHIQLTKCRLESIISSCLSDYIVQLLHEKRKRGTLRIVRKTIGDFREAVRADKRYVDICSGERDSFR